MAKARDPQRRAKIAAAKRGKKRPKHVIEAMRRANLGNPLTKETRRKMSEAHRKRGTRPPWLNAAWTPEEDDLLRSLPAVAPADNRSLQPRLVLTSNAKKSPGRAAMPGDSRAGLWSNMKSISFPDGTEWDL